jgi:hypothetical protein
MIAAVCSPAVLAWYAVNENRRSRSLSWGKRTFPMVPWSLSIPDFGSPISQSWNHRAGYDSRRFASR